MPTKKDWTQTSAKAGLQVSSKPYVEGGTFETIIGKEGSGEQLDFTECFSKYATIKLLKPVAVAPCRS